MKGIMAFLYNGGLDPLLADHKQLRQRRTVSSMYFLMLPLLSVLLVININLFYAPLENIHILAVLLLGVPALFLQAYKGWEGLAAILLVASFVVIPASVILQLGLSSVNWVWIFPSVVIANLVLDRRTAVFAAVVGMACMLVSGLLTHYGKIEPDIVVATHENAVAVTGSLLLIIIFAAGFTFRTIQINDEAKLTAQIARVDKEVLITREAEIAAQAGRRVKATFLEAINHELRTPLNGVIGAGQLLADKAGDSHQQELVDVITHSGEILLDLINNVLDLTEMEAGQLKLQSETMHLESTIQSAMAPLLIGGREKGVEVKYEIAESVPGYVDSDATRLRQILLNLCGNALKFTESGKVELLVSRQQGQISFVVRDTGIGISESEKERLFQPFVQADSSTARRFGGSGLGLTIVSQLVELFGGSVSLESTVGVGSTVTVLLPLREAKPPTISRENAGKNLLTAKPGSLTALIADDNAVNRLVVSRMLSYLGCTMVEVANGYEALLALRQHNIAVVFMDVQMPIMDGMVATSRIRAFNSPQAKVPIVGLSANVTDYNEAKCLAAGMDYYLLKPVRLEHLQGVLTKIQRLQTVDVATDVS